MLGVRWKSRARHIPKHLYSSLYLKPMAPGYASTPTFGARHSRAAASRLRWHGGGSAHSFDELEGRAICASLRQRS
nr:putative integron gene cassette protein [uncultured bacterium]